MKILLTILIVILTPLFLLSIIILFNSIGSPDWGSIPDWIGIMITVSFGVYAIKTWLKPKIDSDVYEYAKKIVIFDFVEAEKKVSDEVTLTYVQNLHFKIANKIFKHNIEPAISNSKRFKEEKLYEKYITSETMQGMIHAMDNDLKLMRKLGKILRPEIEVLKRKLSDTCIVLFLNTTSFWRLLWEFSILPEGSEISKNKVDELDKIVDSLQELRNEYLSISNDIYNYSNDIMDYFVDASKIKR